MYGLIRGSSFERRPPRARAPEDIVEYLLTKGVDIDEPGEQDAAE